MFKSSGGHGFEELLGIFLKKGGFALYQGKSFTVCQSDFCGQAHLVRYDDMERKSILGRADTFKIHKRSADFLCLGVASLSRKHLQREAQPGGKAARGSPRQLQRRARSPVWWWVPRARASPRASLARAEARVG
ncbi:unnamed protein product [Prunus armeniaca]